MKTLHKMPVLWALTGLLAACGNNNVTPQPGGNQLPEVSVKLASGGVIDPATYLSSDERLIVSSSDADGSITKVKWVIDAGRIGERSGEYLAADIRGKIDFSLPNLSSGGHTLSFTVTDNTGATGSYSGGFKVDGEAPLVTSVSVNNNVLTEGQALKFTTGDLATLNVAAADRRGGGDVSVSPTRIIVLVGDVQVKQVIAPASIDLAALIGTATNVNTVKIIAQDSVGNFSSVQSFTVQFSAAVTGGSTGGPGTGGGGSTVVSEPTLGWLSPSIDFVRGGGTVNLKAAAFKAGQDISSQVAYNVSCGSVAGTVWTLGADCADGSKQTITATVVDNGKNYSIVKVVTVDVSDPAVQITSPQQGQAFSNNPISVGVSASDAVSGIERIEVSANGVLVGTVSGATGAVIWAPQNGTYTLKAVAYDRVGRSSSSSLGNVNVQLSSTDNQAPTVTALNLPTGTQHGVVTVKATVKDAPPSSGIAKVELFEGSNSLGVQTSGVGDTYTFSVDTNRLAYGEHTVRAVVTDNVGLTSETTGILSTGSIITPSAVLATTVVAGNSLAGVGPSVQFLHGLGAISGTAAHTVPLTSAQLLIDGAASGTPSGSTGGASFNFDFSTLNEGLHDLSLRWQDSVGTVADSAKLSVFVDKTAPTIIWNSPVNGSVTNAATIPLAASASDAASGVNTVEYSENNSLIPVPAAWAPTEGLHTVTVTATDKVGNRSSQSVVLTVDRTGPMITATSPTNTQEFTTAPVTLSATATDGLVGVKSMEATIQGPKDTAPATLGVQVGDKYSAVFTPVDAGTYTVVFKALDGLGNAAGTVTRTFTYSVTTAPQEKQPSPILALVGNAPYTGNMSVNASGNYDTASAIDRMILQITDAAGKVDNSTYVTPQSNATFSIDTTRFVNGDLKLQIFAYTKTGLLGKSELKTAQILNVNNPALAVASPANGASVTSPTVPVRVTLTSQGTAYNFDPTTLVIKLKDYRGQVIETRSSTSSTPLTCVSSIDLATYTCDTSFDMAGLPADSYTIESTANATVTGATPAVQALKSVSTFKANTSSVNPPASTVRFPIAITSSTGVRTPALADSGSGFFATVSDDVAIKYVEARIVGPYAVGNIETDGTKQCQSSGTPLGTPIDVLLINVPGAALLPYQTQEVFIPNLDIEGSTYVPDNILKPDKTPAQRYDLRVTVADIEGNRNIQCVPVVIQRGLVRSVYATGTTTVPDPTSKKPTYSSGTWTISGIANTSRVVAVLYAKGVQVGTSFRAAVVGNTSVSQTFPEAGTYEVKWLVEDMTTGVVTTVNGGVINVGTNP